jgi:hypothetical protein
VSRPGGPPTDGESAEASGGEWWCWWLGCRRRQTGRAATTHRSARSTSAPSPGSHERHAVLGAARSKPISAQEDLGREDLLGEDPFLAKPHDLAEDAFLVEHAFLVEDFDPLEVSDLVVLRETEGRHGAPAVSSRRSARASADLLTTSARATSLIECPSARSARARPSVAVSILEGRPIRTPRARARSWPRRTFSPWLRSRRGVPALTAAPVARREHAPAP